MGSHLSNAVVYQRQHAGVNSVCNEQASRSSVVQAATNGDEQRSANTTTDGDKLNLTVAQAALEHVGILSNLAILDVDDVVAVMAVVAIR
jgi:hypothetical protein